MYLLCRVLFIYLFILFIFFFLRLFNVRVRNIQEMQ